MKTEPVGTQGPHRAPLPTRALRAVSRPSMTPAAGIILGAALLTLLPAHALAEPMYITFRQMMDRCDVVAVAHLDEKANLDDKKHRIDLVLVRALKGNVKLSVRATLS